MCQASKNWETAVEQNKLPALWSLQINVYSRERGTDVPQLGRPSGKAGAAAVLFFYRLFFKASFRFVEKLRGRFRDFPYAPCPPHMHTLGSSGLFLEIGESTLTHRHHHPEFNLH